jgi:hypothetical protein
MFAKILGDQTPIHVVIAAGRGADNQPNRLALVKRRLSVERGAYGNNKAR